VVPKGAPHPIMRMIELGLNVTVNSDDPPMFGTTLTDEYRQLARWGAPSEVLALAQGNAERARIRTR